MRLSLSTSLLLTHLWHMVSDFLFLPARHCPSSSSLPSRRILCLAIHPLSPYYPPPPLASVVPFLSSVVAPLPVFSRLPSFLFLLPFAHRQGSVAQSQKESWSAKRKRGEINVACVCLRACMRLNERVCVNEWEWEWLRARQMSENVCENEWE